MQELDQNGMSKGGLSKGDGGKWIKPKLDFIHFPPSPLDSPPWTPPWID